MSVQATLEIYPPRAADLNSNDPLRRALAHRVSEIYAACQSGREVMIEADGALVAILNPRERPDPINAGKDASCR